MNPLAHYPDKIVMVDLSKAMAHFAVAVALQDGHIYILYAVFVTKVVLLVRRGTRLLPCVSIYWCDR